MKRQGFTLVELMVTLTVLSILLLAAAPSFSDYFEKARVRGAADQVTNLLARARAESVKSNLPVSVAVNADGDAWCVGAAQPAPPAAWALRDDSASSCNCLQAGQCVVAGEVLRVGSADFGGQSPTVAVTGFAFSYTPKLGGVSTNSAPGKSFLSGTNSSLAITSPNGRYELRVVVTPLGQSYVCIPAGKPAFFGYRACPA